MSAIKIKSIEDASVIRKFSVLFSFMSLFPLVILTALFFIFYFRGALQIDINFFLWTVLLVGVFSFIGFIGMRSSLGNLNKMTDEVKSVLKSGVPKQIGIKTAGDNEIAQIARSFNEVVQKLESTITEMEKSKGMLQEVLTAVASGAASSENINAFLNLILKTTVGAINAETGLLLLTQEKDSNLIVESSFGLENSDYSKIKSIAADTEMAGWVVKQQKPLLIPRITKESSIPAETKDNPFQPPLICVPLIFQNKVLGVLSISSPKRKVNFDEDELFVVSNISTQIALAIENARLNSDAQKTYLETISALAMAVEARDLYSRGHSDRVGEYSVKIARTLGLSEEQIKTIKDAALLHDVGKIGISDDILRKPGPLNEYEMEIMKQHPVIGEGIILPLRGLSRLKEPVRHHHEWLNGMGYPDKVAGEKITIETKILTVADAFDAMTSDRPYRKKLPLETAINELQKYINVRYDPAVVEALITCVRTEANPESSK
ncbi:MAG: HD domain-containing protein [Candidatus Omnitrophica bacterium]|nr:HD domain-containing protein [Candidatus Omnitrophota bacterium]